MKPIPYKGYQILKRIRQGTSCFVVKTPSGLIWSDFAANIETAKKWIDADFLNEKLKGTNQ